MGSLTTKQEVAMARKKESIRPGDHPGSIQMESRSDQPICRARNAGGMALSTLVPATVNSISSLARSSNAGLQLWSFHALLLTIEAAGLSYVSQVQATLTLAIDILLADENGWGDLRQGIGRLINAIVAVIGPELAPGSTFFSRCKVTMIEERIEENLFRMLDEETDSEYVGAPTQMGTPSE
ncbi:hypothetical protein Taro_007411 [Colocasia esculenta]|uniref:Uncharacterized protein n=1 Tax=Colocasia esculenta TaxID=4460 RepID=A0A843TZM1_COLES|nr:hypothetical protein [Colocasia esculenta]